MAKEIEVKITGRSFVFQIPKQLDPQEFMKIVNHVEERIQSIRRDITDLDSFKLGLLASINLAEELFAAQKENQRLREILKKIDTTLAPFEQQKKQKGSRKEPIRFSSP